MSKGRAIPPEPSWVGILSKLDNQTQILKKIQSNKITVHLKEILSCVVCKEIGIKNGVMLKCSRVEQTARFYTAVAISFYAYLLAIQSVSHSLSCNISQLYYYASLIVTVN